METAKAEAYQHHPRRAKSGVSSLFLSEMMN